MSHDIIPDLTTTDPAATSAVAVLPVGAFEQHGPHLPLGTDTLIACAITAAITEHHQMVVASEQRQRGATEELLAAAAPRAN